MKVAVAWSVVFVFTLICGKHDIHYIKTFVEEFGEFLFLFCNIEL